MRTAIAAALVVLLAACGTAKKTGAGGGATTTTSGITAPSKSSGSAFAIDMTDSPTVACPPPSAVSVRTPKPVLAAVFTVHHGATSYVLGWQIVPYLGANRSYKLGVPGDLLVLAKPATNSPLGFGSGTVTFASTPYSGTLNAVIKLTAGGSLTAGGAWRCTSHV